MQKLEYLTDGKRHLICRPYSVSNLHKMAKELNINKCHFELSKNGRKPHYDIPKLRKQEIELKCTFIKSKEIIKIINSSGYENKSKTRKQTKIQTN